ncbi:MAG: sigma-70 family RNA polymerase sigma factor, partial [Verrucomicrobiaceae bacterium]
VFEMVKLKGMDVEETAAALGVKRSVVDNTIYRAMNALRELARDPVYRQEYYP